MEIIFVTGHRNPDTDSIVAALAYAALQNAMGNREYEAAALGRVSDETQTVLDRFGFAPPQVIRGMHTQIKDLAYDTPPILSKDVTVGKAWQTLQQQELIRSLPVANEDGTLYGILSRDQVANYNMTQVLSGILEEVPLFNVLSVLEGSILNAAGENVDSIAGEVCIAVPMACENLLFSKPDSIVLCGNQPDMMRRAIEKNVKALILCQAELPEELRKVDTKTCIISTPYDACRAAMLLFQSIPVQKMCLTEGIIKVYLSDRLDDVKDQLTERDYIFPVIDENEKVVGIITRYHLLRPNRKRVVLVDHNEASQSVPGLDQAEIVAIIDHHRLADIQTNNPIYVRNEPVGCTNTIIASMFQERGLQPSPGLAGLMASAILSDTVMFKSPTCTERDKIMAERMARIANESIDELGKAIFASSTGNKTPQELLDTDYKEFHIAGNDLAVGQITVVDTSSIMERKQEFIDLMQSRLDEKGFAVVVLMVTDVLKEGSYLLFAGPDDIIEQAFHVVPKDNMVFLPGVMSRKKQIIPMLSAMWG